MFVYKEPLHDFAIMKPPDEKNFPLSQHVEVQLTERERFTEQLFAHCFNTLLDSSHYKVRVWLVLCVASCSILPLSFCFCSSLFLGVFSSLL